MKSQIPNPKSSPYGRSLRQISPNTEIPNFESFGHWNLFGNWKLKIGNSQQGFTLIELLVVVFITALLTGLVSINFQTQRAQQEVQAAAQEIISRIRAVQSYVLTGREVASSLTPDAYEIILSANSTSYVINYLVVSGDGSETTTLLENVNLSQNLRISQVYNGQTSRSQIRIRMDAPFGTILVDGASGGSAQIDLLYPSSGYSRSVVIDGISGRIGIK